MHKLYELYIEFMVWLGAAPPPGHNRPSPEENFRTLRETAKINSNIEVTPRVKTRNLETSSLSKTPKNWLQKLIEDISEPTRVIIATFIVFLIFLITDQILFWIFKWLTQDIQLRNSFFKWLLDGIEVLSAVSVALYFPIQGILGLKDQWETSNKIKRSK